LSFGVLPEKIVTSEVPRFVSILGLTFSNYEPSEILNLLKKIAGQGSFILIDIQLRERINISELQGIYQKYVAPACDQKIKLLS
jgi:hypothetical protein